MVPVGASTEDIARTFVSSTSRAMLFGAGLSASELPQFGQLFESSLSALAASDAQMVGFADLLTDTAAAGCSKRPRPEEFFAAVEAEAPGAGLSLAQSAYSTGNPGPAHYMAVEVSRHSDAPILTTNFDTLLEAAAGDAAVEVRHLHGTTEDRSSIAVAVNNVAGHNARRVRRFAGSVLRGSVVLVAGYQGLDSDVFPLLNEADHLLWLVFADPTADPVVLASQRFPHLAHLRNRVTVFCDDVQGVLAAIAAADGYTPPCPPPAVSSVTPDWESAVRQWAAGLAPLKRRLVIARLLSHAGHFEESGALYEAITTEARGSRKPQEEAAAIAGTVRVVGSSLGDYDAARKGLDRLMTLSALPGIRGRTSLISALLNTMEAAAVVGVRFPRARYVAALLPPWTSGDYARGGKLIRQAAARLMRRRRRLMSRALFRAALLLAAWRGDFEEGVVVRWYQALSDVEIGMYDRAYGRLSAIPPTDLDFVGVTFRFWFDWLLREFDRLGIRGEPPIPKYGANLPPNPGASLLDDVSRLSTARLNGLIDYADRDLAIARADSKLGERETLELRLRVAIESALPFDWSRPRHGALVEHVRLLERAAQAEHDWLTRDYARLLRSALHDDSVSTTQSASLLISRSHWVRATALLGDARLVSWRGAVSIRRMVARGCRRRGMQTQADELDQLAGFSWDRIQFP